MATKGRIPPSSDSQRKQRQAFRAVLVRWQRSAQHRVFIFLLLIRITLLFFLEGAALPKTSLLIVHPIHRSSYFMPFLAWSQTGRRTVRVPGELGLSVTGRLVVSVPHFFGTGGAPTAAARLREATRAVERSKARVEGELQGQTRTRSCPGTARQQACRLVHGADPCKRLCRGEHVCGHRGRQPQRAPHVDAWEASQYDLGLTYDVNVGLGRLV